MTPGLAEILESYRWSNNLMSSNCLNLRNPNKRHYAWFPYSKWTRTGAKRRQRGGRKGLACAKVSL